ncbi:MAG: hypothetical protein QNJ68_09170 [Microcoleaceae cyanobacterium MO_207.B10]|nr:hypothetical protein [Microcoleaceae cyanobacterium MO_207.B10]
MRKPYQEADIFALINKYLGVHYVYQQNTKETNFQLDNFPAIASDLISALPDNWLAEFQQAVIECDQILTLSLIDQIRHLDESLGNCLTYLAMNFEFEELENIFIKSE